MEYIKKKYVNRKLLKPFSGKYNIIDLTRMLTYPRPADSEMEKKYITKFIDIVPGMRRDKFGNRFISIGEKPTTLFASHTDTVHSHPEKYKTKWNYSPESDEYWGERTKVNVKDTHRNIVIEGKWARGTGKDVLGADDTTGNWIMLNLISEKKPGLYIFHRAEEEGRRGSEWIAENKPELVKGIKRAIAFDRRGYQDIITHQLGERTASDKFANELGRRIGSGYKSDPSGAYTDTLSYAHLIPECTNISVGFKGAHSSSEQQNLTFARHLYTRLRDIDFETLPVERKPELKRKSSITWLDWAPYIKSFSGWDYKTSYKAKDIQNHEQINKSRKEYQERLAAINEVRSERLPSGYLRPKNAEEERQLLLSIRKEADEKEIRKEAEEGVRKLFGVADDDEYYNYVYNKMKSKKKEGVIE